MIASLFLAANSGLLVGVALASFKISLNILGLLLFIFLFFRPKFKIILVFLIFLIFGFWRYNTYERKSLAVDLSKYNGHKVVLQGVVSEEVDPGGNYQKVTVSVSQINGKVSSGLVLVSLSKYPEFKYGDILELSGNLAAPNNFSDFKYDRYLARYDIYSVMSWPKVTVKGYRFDFYARLLNFKSKVYQIINLALPEPEAGLASALLLGYKGTLDTAEKNAFSCCGLSHIVAISGSHLTLLSALAFDFLLFFGLSNRQAFRPVVIFLWFYTFLTGPQTSALRAALMGHLTLWGKQNGRQDAGGRLLVTAAAMMLLLNPLLLRDDLGFQLSFLAMLALIYFCPWGEKIWGQGSLKSVIILTSAAQLLTWPISALNFGRFSIIAPLANLLVVWIFAWLLPALLLGAALSWIIPVLRVLWFMPSYFMLKYVILLSNWLSTWPQACLDLKISPRTLVIYYIILILVYFLLNKRVAQRLS
ncbi:MAG: ComEC/Rec2 family competence protein [Candidatus Falkowbacteria bacterium]